jgi:hypothetical protein
MPAHILREEEGEDQNDIAHKTNGLEDVENDGQPSTKLGIVGDGQACTRACPFMWSVSGWQRCQSPLLYLSSKPLLLQSDRDCAAATRRNERARSSERSDWKLNRVGSVQNRSTQTERTKRRMRRRVAHRLPRARKKAVSKAYSLRLAKQKGKVDTGGMATSLL